MKQSMILIVVLLFSFTQLKAQLRHELSVREAVDLAFKNLTEVKNAELDYKIQESLNRQIFGQALPQVSGNVAGNHYLQLPAFLFPDATSTAVYSILKEEGVKDQFGNPITNVPAPTMRQVSFQQPWNLAAGITLQQLLFQPDVFVGLQARKTALQISEHQLEQVKEKVKDSAYKRYYAILIAEKQLHFLNEGVKRLEKLSHDNLIMFQNGFAERLDVDKVEVQLTNLRTTRNIVENGVRLAYAALKFSIGLPQADSVALKEDLAIEKVKEGILDESFNYTDRAEVRTLEATKQLQELDVKRYKLGYIPTVAAIVNYSVNGMGPEFFTDESTVWLRSSYIGVNVSVPLFDGYQRRNKMQQARYNVQKIDNTISYVKQAIDLEQYATRETFKNSILNLDAQQRNMELAEKVFNTTRIKFQEGLGSSFEVLLADSEYQSAQANYFNALYNAIVAKISYQRALGKLN